MLTGPQTIEKVPVTSATHVHTSNRRTALTRLKGSCTAVAGESSTGPPLARLSRLNRRVLGEPDRRSHEVSALLIDLGTRRESDRAGLEHLMTLRTLLGTHGCACRRSCLGRLCAKKVEHDAHTSAAAIEESVISARETADAYHPGSRCSRRMHGHLQGHGLPRLKNLASRL